MSVDSDHWPTGPGLRAEALCCELAGATACSPFFVSVELCRLWSLVPHCGDLEWPNSGKRVRKW